MLRKTIQLAKNTLVVSLPAKWVRQHQITKGTELHLETSGPTLKISKEGQSTIKETDLDARELSERVLKWTLSSLYKKGYTQITINFNSKDQLNTIKELTKEQFIGFAITDQRKSSVTIRAIATEDPTAFETSLRRAFLVKLSLASQILEHLRDEQDLSHLLELEKTNNQLVDFCERLINNKQIQSENASFRYVIAWNLEKVCDEYKYIIQQHKEPRKIDPKVLQYFEEVNNLVRAFYKLIYDYKEKDLVKQTKIAKELWNKGYGLLEKKKEKILIHHLIKIISSTRDFSSSIIALQR